MKPSEVKQYLFRIDYNNIDEEKKPLCVGKLDITWRYSFGENGRLQTHPLEQPVNSFKIVFPNAYFTHAAMKLKFIFDKERNL